MDAILSACIEDSWSESCCRMICVIGLSTLLVPNCRKFDSLMRVPGVSRPERNCCESV